MLKTHNTNDDKIETLLSRSEIPIIDLAHTGTDDRPSRSVVNRVAIQLHKALSEKGLALLVNHGICEDKLQSAWSYLDDFCDLPTDVKEVYIRKGDDNHGYVKPDQPKFDGPALRHAYNICTLSAANLPEEPLPGFKDHIAELAHDFKALSSLILQSLSIALHLRANYLQENHSHMLNGLHENETVLRLLYYPPIIEDDNKCELTKGRCKYSYQRCAMDRLDLDQPDEAVTDGEHVTRKRSNCDYGTFTLLCQDSEGGLEVKLPGSQKWKRVGHLPGAILINTGEILATWSQNTYPALQHRVIIPEQDSVRSRGRHSIAFFCHPDNDVPIEPIVLPSEQPEVEKKPRKSSFRIAKDKVSMAYQSIQRKFRKNYQPN